MNNLVLYCASTRFPDRERLVAENRSVGPSRRQFSTVFMWRAVAMAATVLQSIVLARVLGAEVFGGFSFAISTISIVALLVSLGLDQLFMRDLSAVDPDCAEGRERVVGVLALSATVVAPGCVFVAAGGVALLVMSSEPTRDANPYIYPLVVVLVTLPILMLRKFAEAGILAVKRPVLSFVGSNLIFPTMISVGVVLAERFVRVGPLTISAVYAVALFASAAFAVLVLRPELVRRLRAGRGPVLNRVPLRGTLRTSASLALVGSGFLISQNLDVILTGVFATPGDVATVRIVSRLGEMIAIFRVITLLQYKPYLAKAGMAGDWPTLERLMARMTRTYVLTGAPLMVVAFALSSQILSLWGPDFAESEWTFRVYMLGVFVMLLGGPAATALSLSGHEKWAVRSLWTSVAVGAAGNCILIPMYGAFGCALASLASMIVLAWTSNRWARTRMGVNATVFTAFRRSPPAIS